MTHQYRSTRPILVERSSSSHSSFLSNIYLDPNCVIPESPTISPDHADSPITTDTTEEERELSRTSSNDSGEYEDLDDLQVSAQICIRNNYTTIGGGTKPLRVKKKKGVTAVKVGSKTKKRISIAYSPSSSANSYSYSRQLPKDPTSPRHTSKPRRNPSSNSGKSNLSKTYANISSIFLNLPSPSDSPLTPRDHPEKMRSHPQGRFSDSSLHLGLGKFTSYDPISPGPSPPTSPLPSPNKRTFVSSSPNEYRKKALPIPPSPLTPSRAPRKAAALLGVHTPSHGNPKMGSGKKTHGLNTKHFRPLPNSTLTEIEKFFGDVPHKSKKSSSSTSTKPRSKGTSASAGAGGGMDERGMGDRKVGQGETVKYKSEDGSMWLDVEEEQEFAWLLSEILALIPQPLPDTDTSLSKIRTNDSTSSREERDRWEMENFTSVLSLPKPKPTKTNGGKSGRKGKGSDNSFLDLDTPKPPRELNINPWSHKRSLSNPTSPTKLSISPPMPALIPPPRTSSKPASSLPNDPSPMTNGYCSNTPSGSGSGSGSDSEKFSSPPRIKNRPPPLTLKRIKPSSKLPILTATAPSTHPSTGPRQSQLVTAKESQPQPRAVVAQQIPDLTSEDKGRYNITVPIPHPQVQSKKYETPSTPFVRPRAALRPLASEGEGVPPVPPLPFSIPVKEEPTSFFEPVTPTEPHGTRKNNTQEERAGKEKKSWLKRVVRRPLKG
ncbi:hypothetical protein I302_106226 [Kwoniella bestiolae CBS 10118]|uniref:Uncharacterized protein n=1 Tax=Kwoniella bestiolae CBS 10118 TaxID=1296100 RepID=A0A1B9G3E5_9TREE|nr:hypothetical protein I302_05350 [Kwoniella bestiolae CBS 10118]OCF25530.1 hypothetical protein I302_05350 [Kwoniella bestiolae CBS 10118]